MTDQVTKSMLKWHVLFKESDILSVNATSPVLQKKTFLIRFVKDEMVS